MELKNVVEILFTGKSKLNNKIIEYKDISDKIKEDNFFIINRFLSKKYPLQAQYFNNKEIDKATALDIWNMQLKKEYRTPVWFWTGKRTKEKPALKDWELLLDYYDDLDIDDIFFLIKNNKEETQKELNFLQKIEKERNK